MQVPFDMYDVASLRAFRRFEPICWSILMGIIPPGHRSSLFAVPCLLIVLLEYSCWCCRRVKIMSPTAIFCWPSSWSTDRLILSWQWFYQVWVHLRSLVRMLLQPWITKHIFTNFSDFSYWNYLDGHETRLLYKFKATMDNCSTICELLRHESGKWKIKKLFSNHAKPNRENVKRLLPKKFLLFKFRKKSSSINLK